MDTDQATGSIKVVTGAGPVGWTVALRLAGEGHRVRVLTRSGSGPDHPLVERRRADAANPTTVHDACEGADAIFHCIHASTYNAAAWRRELPPAERNVLAAAAAGGAVAVFPESLYSCPDPSSAMTEEGPHTAAGGKRGVRTELLAARAASPARTVSVIASDFFGPRVIAAHAGERLLAPLLSGRRVRVMGRADLPHSFTYVPDLAAAMIRAAATPSAWNAVLHAPTGPALTQGEMAAAFAAAAGLPAPRVGTIPGWTVRVGGVLSAQLRDLSETLYQFQRPFVMESAATCRLLGMEPTPLEVAARETVLWWRRRQAGGGGT